MCSFVVPKSSKILDSVLFK